MDPHTGVAKNVADQLSLGSEVPVVIAATAHFSKFSEAILDTFDIQKSSATSKPHDLMAKALTLSDFPKKHHRLAQDVALPRIHTEVNDQLPLFFYTVNIGFAVCGNGKSHAIII